MCIRDRQWCQAHLCCPATIQRTVIRQSMFLHHADERTWQDQHHITVFQNLIPNILQDRWKSRIDFYKIRKLINDKYLLFFWLDVYKRQSFTRSKIASKSVIPGNTGDTKQTVRIPASYTCFIAAVSYTHLILSAFKIIDLLHRNK